MEVDRSQHRGALGGTREGAIIAAFAKQPVKTNPMAALPGAEGALRSSGRWGGLPPHSPPGGGTNRGEIEMGRD